MTSQTALASMNYLPRNRLTCRNIGRNSRSCNLSTIVNADGIDQLQSGVWANRSVQINDRPVFPQKRTFRDCIPRSEY